MNGYDWDYPYGGYYGGGGPWGYGSGYNPYGYGYGGGYYSPPYYYGGYYARPYWEGPWTGGRYYDYNVNYMLEDNEIVDLVRDNIDMDPYISRSDKDKITIEVEDGVVTLSGTVRDRRSKPLAYADAFWTDGVVDVESSIKVEQRERGGGERGAKEERKKSGRTR